MNNEQSPSEIPQADIEKMQQCMAQAAAIVSAYRAQAPEDCDPKNTYAALAMGAMAVVGAGTSAYGASQQPGTSNPEPERDARHNMQAYLRSLGGQYGLENLYRPLYGNLSNRETSNMLFGTEQATIRRRIPWTDSEGNRSYRQIRINRPGSPGMLSMIGRAQGEVEDLYYGDQLDQREGLMNSLAGQAQEDLDMGYGMSPGLRRELEQSTIGSASLRGFGHSPLDAYETYRALGSEAESLRRQRQGFAMNVGSMLSQARPDAVTAAQLVGASSGMAGSSGPRLVNPFAGMGGQPPPGANGQANAMMALGGGMLSGAGQMYGAYQAGRQPPPQTSYYNPSSPYPLV